MAFTARRPANDDLDHVVRPNSAALLKIVLCGVLISVAFGWSICVGGRGSDVIVLDGMHRFSPGDRPEWSSLSCDDTGWGSIKVPGSWQSQHVKSVKQIGWYRIHFNVPEDFRDSAPAVLLGRIGDVDEVFLNGVQIGREGLIAERFVEATKVERLYKIPGELVRYGDANVLAVRVMNTYLNGGIFDKGVMIGDYQALLIEKLRRTHYSQLIEFCFFTIFAIFFVTCFFFYVRGLRDREYISFWVFISLYGVLFVLESVTFYNTGLKTPFVQQIINSLTAILPAMLVLLLITVYQEKMGLWTKLFLLAFPMLALAIVLFPGHLPRVYFYKIWKIFFVAAAIFIVSQAVKAYLRRCNESGPILLGISGLLIGLILESVGGLDLLQITGFFLWDYSAVFFMICVTYALTARFMRIEGELRSASLRIFSAHEDERKSLARELHDGIGQSLLSVKLRLKMLASKAGGKWPPEEESFSELVSDITHSIDEVRAMARDLRPSFLENVDFVDALRWHAEKMQKQSGIRIRINAECSIALSSRMKENVYRICQEGLSNAIRHSEAESIDVTITVRNRVLLLEIKDDGRGFDPALIERRGAGIGLYTIRERAELLSGVLRIRSSDRMGTTLSIEVPVE